MKFENDTAIKHLQRSKTSLPYNKLKHQKHLRAVFSVTYLMVFKATMIKKYMQQMNRF